jgi:hypothetical protein
MHGEGEARRGAAIKAITVGKEGGGGSRRRPVTADYIPRIIHDAADSAY